ncbi:cytochrome P450 [Rhodococcus sp. USK10]|uniref:cytochrome P450 n=1 Tax=Rhodococcus sp. USK10 TaxID=2789739 RepID=UPI001C5FC39C|nr:cytochrome P450 [Rhodococcus sp. USK10]QYB07082.1 cytochrome P450 [Rhodococcus sp. USK10]
MSTLDTLNPTRVDPLVPAAVFARLRETEPVSKVRMPGGQVAWLVTRHDLIREVLGNPAFSADFFHFALLTPDADTENKIPGMFNRMDAPEHTRYRKALQRPFTAPAIARLRPQIERIVAVTLDECSVKGRNVDFVADFALPIPSLVICELLGVPYADREQFHRWSQIIMDLGASPEDSHEARTEMPAYIAGIARQYRVREGTGLISDLVRDHGDEFTDEEIGGLGFELLLAGHETTANMMSLSALVAMTNPEARDLFTRGATDAELDVAIRELLRYLSITHMSPLRRTTRSGLVVGGIEFAEGDYVCCHVPAANRDPQVWSDADELKLDRKPEPHLAFGFGVHLCLGQALARLELQVALPAFFGRFPEAALATDLDDLRFRTEMFVYGLHALPTTLY